MTTVMFRNTDWLRKEQVEFGATGIASMILSIIFFFHLRWWYKGTLLESSGNCTWKTTVDAFANIEELRRFLVLFSCSYHNYADVLLLDFIKFLSGSETYHYNLCTLIMWEEKISNRIAWIPFTWGSKLWWQSFRPQSHL